MAYCEGPRDNILIFLAKIVNIITLLYIKLFILLAVVKIEKIHVFVGGGKGKHINKKKHLSFRHLPRMLKHGA